jgi:hypothetical protein
MKGKSVAALDTGVYQQHFYYCAYDKYASANPDEN